MRLKCFFYFILFPLISFFSIHFSFHFSFLLVCLLVGVSVYWFNCSLIYLYFVTVSYWSQCNCDESASAPSLFSWWWLYTVTAQAVHYEWIHLYATQCQERPVNLSCSQVPCLLSTDIRTFTFRHSFSLPVSFSFSGSSDYAVMCFVWRIYAKLKYINPAL